MIKQLKKVVKEVAETPIPLGYAICAVAVTAVVFGRPKVVIFLAGNT